MLLEGKLQLLNTEINFPIKLLEIKILNLEGNELYLLSNQIN